MIPNSRQRKKPLPNRLAERRNKMARVILIVKDEFLLRLDSAETIEHAGFEVVQAANADDAIAILTAQPDIHVVFTDIQMPDKNGLSLCRDLHANHPDLPVIAMSGSGPIVHNEELQSALKAGARSIVAKPFKLDEFYTAVAHALAVPNL